MPKMLTIFVLFGGVAVCQNNTAPSGNAEKGKRLFLKNGCYECRGTMGQGGTGPRLAPRPLALSKATPAEPGIRNCALETPRARKPLWRRARGVRPGEIR